MADTVQITGLTDEQIKAAMATLCAATDDTALVLPLWLAIEDGDNPDELRSEKVKDESNDLGKVRAVMMTRTAPGDREWAVNQNQSNDFLAHEDEGEGSYLLADTYKIGVFEQYVRGNYENSSEKKVVERYDAIVARLSQHRKLGIDSPHMLNHGDVQRVRTYCTPFDKVMVHVIIGTIVVRHKQYVKTVPEP